MDKKTRISVALATYNGETFIEEQLQSLINQSRQPDEIIIVDDNSSDSTIKIVDSIKNKTSIVIKIFLNATNIGHQKSFDKAIELCTGEIIFLCDQDDVWYENKIELVETIFFENKHINIIINDLDICDVNLVKLGYSVIEQTRNSGTFGDNGKSFIIGCGTAFRSSLKILINQIPDIPYGHDKWIHEIGNFLSSRKVIQNKLQLYRRHGNNSSKWAFDINRKANWTDMINPTSNIDLRLIYLNQLYIVSCIYRRIMKLSQYDFDSLNINSSKNDVTKKIEIAIKSIASRIELISSNSMFIKFKAIKMLLFREYNYFLGFKSFLKDFILRKPI